MNYCNQMSKFILISWLRKIVWGILRQLSQSLMLIGSAMFGATFNLVTRVGLP